MGLAAEGDSGLQPGPGAVTLKSLGPDVYTLGPSLALSRPAQPAWARHCPLGFSFEGEGESKAERH